MSTRGVGAAPFDAAPWAALAQQVQKVKADVIEAGRTQYVDAAEAERPGKGTTALAARMKEVLSRHPNLVEASPMVLADAAKAAAKLDAIATPLTALATGLEAFDRLPAAHRTSWSCYTYAFRQLETVLLLKDALEAAGDALAKFPTAQVDALEHALRAELSSMGQTHGDAIRRTLPHSMPLDQVFEGEALKIFDGLQKTLATLATEHPHELFDEVAARNFGAAFCVEAVQRSAGRSREFLVATTVLAKLAGLAAEHGAPLDTERLMSALTEHDPDNAVWGDVLYAYVKATHPDIEIERRPRPKSVASLVTVEAQYVWRSLREWSPISNAIAGNDGLELLAAASAKVDGRALTGQEVLAIAYEVTKGVPNVVATLNSLAGQHRLDPVFGMPAGIAKMRAALLSSVAKADEIAADVQRKLAGLATKIDARRKDAMGASREARRALQQSPPDAVAGIVADAVALLDEAREDADDHRRTLTRLVEGFVRDMEGQHRDLRTKEGEFRIALAPLRGTLDASPTADGLAHALDQIERNAVAKVKQVEKKIDVVVDGRAMSGVRAALAGAELELEEAIVSLLRLGARTTKVAEVHAERLEAAEAATARLKAVLAEPASSRRLVELPIEDVRAYRLPSNVMRVVETVRRMSLKPLLAMRVMAGVLKFDEGHVTLRETPSPLASAIAQANGVYERVGSGVSPRQAIEWLDNNVEALIAQQEVSPNRTVVMEFVEGLVASLQSMERSSRAGSSPREPVGGRRQ